MPVGDVKRKPPEIVLFGFRAHDEDALVRDEAKQAAVAEMVALRAEGEPLRAIVAATAERQSDQPRGGVADIADCTVKCRIDRRAELQGSLGKDPRAPRARSSGRDARGHADEVLAVTKAL
jgi:hypothetical protein